MSKVYWKEPSISVVECVFGPSIGAFFLVETYHTSEGPRTRVCSGRWKTLKEAQEELQKREAYVAL